MQISASPQRKGLWTTIGFLTASLSLQLTAYQQGSYYLFDIIDAAPESGKAGRIVVAPSVFKTKAVQSETKIAGQKPRSEFETKITSFGEKESDLDLTDVKPLNTEGNDSKTGSSFGESPPAPSGFFFTY